MKNHLKDKSIGITGVCFCLLVLLASPAHALTITDSSTFNVSLNDSAYITESTAVPSSFNQEIMTLGNETESGTVAFSAIPYFTFGSTLYFQFIYDMQETGGSGLGGRPISIDDLVVSVSGPTVVWDYDDVSYGSIFLNSAAPFTTTPLGAGGDLALYVPVSLFSGLGLTGSSLLTLTATQSDSGNGTDEWIVLGEGTFFGPDDPIDGGGSQAVIPEPSTLVLLGSGLLGLFYAGRRRNRQ